MPDQTHTLLRPDLPVLALRDVGPKRGELLAQLGIVTIGDLLLHFPRAYEDRRHFREIGSLKEGEDAVVRGVVREARNQRLRGRRSMASVTVEDPTGSVKATFFNRGFLADRVLTPGVGVVLSGSVRRYGGLCFSNPDYETLEDGQDLLHVGRIVPVYRLTEGLNQRQMRAWVHEALEGVRALPAETLPATLRRRRNALGRMDALRQVHFPEELGQAEACREQFAYEELLTLQAAVLRKRTLWRRGGEGVSHCVNGPFLKALAGVLPFQLTVGQERAISGILRDMAAKTPMLRLLQGDVGCGKTVVAVHAMAAAADSGCQSALMVPTEVLAEQHFAHLRALLEPLGLKVALLTGGMRGAAAIRRAIAQGEYEIVVGTHALIQQDTLFKRLGLAIIDEQHRFGVLQRQALQGKGVQPDLLYMTATPIPRTLSLTLYGELDLSIIRELPPGRLPIKTRRIPPEKIPDMYGYICRQAAEGRRTFIICPLVEESEERELTSVTAHYEELSAGPLQGVRTALIHGRMDSSEKEDVMRRLKGGEIDVLFSTTVIEVGVDVPEATTMVIENAGSFGLPQLHQLRGRVGRGSEQAYCFLLGDATPEGDARQDALCRYASGFDIAEADLRLRGPGEFLGLRQAGMTDLRAADLLRDAELLEEARRDAEELLAGDPELRQPGHEALREAAERWLAVLP